MNRDVQRGEAMARREPRPAAGPEHVVVDLTNRCNNNCLACWTRSPLLRDQGPPPEWFEQELPTDLARSLLSDLASMGCGIVRFTGGGEPTLHPGFAELACRTAELGMFCAVTTNGTLLHKVGDEVLAAIDELTVSLWSASPQVYSRLHPNKTGRTFDRVAARLEQLSAERSQGHKRPELVIANVINMANHHELEGMLAFAERVGAARVYFALVDPVPTCTDGLLLSKEVAAELRDRAAGLFENWRGRLQIDNAAGFLRRLHENDAVAGCYDRSAVDEVPCLVGWFFARVMANGDVVPCCRAVMRAMGNLHQQTLAEIWTAEPYLEFRRHADQSRAHSPYFKDIGCITSCDNLMHNQDWQRRLEARAAPVHAVTGGQHHD